jgi:hypothetical protein
MTMRFATQDLKFQGLNPGEIVDFTSVENVDQLKSIIVDYFVPLCRNCASEKTCAFHDDKQPPCPMLQKRAL